MVRTLRLFCLAAVVAAVTAACAGTPAASGVKQAVDPVLVGKWIAAGGEGLSFEFKADGRLLMGSASAKQVFGCEAVNGKGKYWDINYGSKLAGATLAYEIDGDQLTLTLAGNQIYELARAP
jgi:hypothetical protein